MGEPSDDPNVLAELQEQLAAATARADGAEQRLSLQKLRAGADLLDLASDELQRSERMLQAIFGRASDGMLLLHDDGRFVDANAAACALLELTKDEILRREVGSFPEAPREISLATFAELKAVGHFQAQGTLHRPDGERRHVTIAAVASIGTGLHLLVLKDVTDEHEAAASLASSELALRRTDARYRAMVEKSAEAIALLSPTGEIQYVSRQAQEIFGASPAQMLGTSAASWVWPEDRKWVRAAVARAARTGAQIQFRVPDARGEARWLEVVVTNLLADPAIGAIVINARDSTARRRQESEREKLLASLTFERGRLGTLLAEVPAFMAVLRGDGHVFELANGAYYDLVGQRELLGKPFREALPEMVAPGYVGLLDAVLRTGEPLTRKAQEVSIAGKGQTLETRYVNFILQPLFEASGAVSGVFIHGVDVTEETIAQRRLRDQFNGVPVPLYAWRRAVVDGQPDFLFIDCNQAARVRSKGQLEKGLGGSLRQLYPEEHQVFADMTRCLDNRETFQREADLVSMGFDTPRRLLVTYSPAPPDVVLLHSEDVTDQRKLEHQLRQAQKMEAVGRLAGGVAHDFNNLLSVVLSYTSLAIEELPPEEPIRDDLEQVKHAGHRAVELTRQLLAFSRQQVLQPRSISLRDTILGLEKMLRRLVGEGIELHFDLRSRGPVDADPGQMEQVIMNLVINARDAMPAGGKITVVVHDVQRGEVLQIEPATTADGPLVCLCVNDTGSGMDESTRAQIFEPFFTTKGAGKGTGLGLATVFGIVQQSGGTIGVQSRQGEGSETTFRIYLPRAARAEQTFSAAPKVGPARGGTETLLVVEDEAPLRALTVTVLRRAGYDVLEARDGADALAVAAECARPIHLLVTDVVMPRMNGRALADRLGAERPGLKILFMSGYTDDAAVLQRVLASSVAFLQKPLTPSALLHKIREVLDEPL